MNLKIFVTYYYYVQKSYCIFQKDPEWMIMDDLNIAEAFPD